MSEPSVGSAGALLPPQSQLPVLTTRRLLLRAMTVGDAPDVFDYAKDPEVLRYTTGTTPERVEQTREFLEGAVTATDGRIWAIRLRDSTTVIGAIELSLTTSELASIHYVLGKPHWGEGLMTEAVDTVCSWAFATLSSLIEIRTAAAEENVGSARVLEKCGFRRVGTTVERWQKQDEPVRLAIFSRRR